MNLHKCPRCKMWFGLHYSWCLQLSRYQEQRKREQEVRVPICNYCWGSHGCELPKGDHTTHQCSIPMTDEDGLFSVVMCCEYDEKADPDHRVRHNHARDDEPTEWGEWGPYGEGWRVW